MTHQAPLFDARRAALPAARAGDFDAFWAAYPPRRPNPRAMAEKEFARLLRQGVDPALLVAAAQAYASECARKGVREDFVVHARTFLAQHRWRDYLPDPPKKPASPQPAAASPEHRLWRRMSGLVPAHEFGAFLGRCEVLAWEEGQLLRLLAPSRFVRDEVVARFAVVLKRACNVRRVDVLCRGEAGAPL